MKTYAHIQANSVGFDEILKDRINKLLQRHEQIILIAEQELIDWLCDQQRLICQSESHIQQVMRHTRIVLDQIHDHNGCQAHRRDLKRVFVLGQLGSELVGLSLTERESKVLIVDHVLFWDVFSVDERAHFLDVWLLAARKLARVLQSEQIEREIGLDGRVEPLFVEISARHEFDVLNWTEIVWNRPWMVSKLWNTYRWDIIAHKIGLNNDDYKTDESEKEAERISSVY